MPMANRPTVSDQPHTADLPRQKPDALAQNRER
jgi:hypothetical protein